MLTANVIRTNHRFNRQHEESEQQRFVNWVKREFPHVVIWTDYAAGLKLTDNQRIKMVGMRSRDGMPDIYIDYPSRGYHGMRIELKKTGTVIYKRDGKTLRKAPYTRKFRKNGKIWIKRGDHLMEQAITLKEYNRLGYCARFAKGIDHAKQLFLAYMGIAENEQLPF